MKAKEIVEQLKWIYEAIKDEPDTSPIGRHPIADEALLQAIDFIETNRTVSCYNCKFRTINSMGESICRLKHISARHEIKCDIYEFGDDGVNPFK